MKRVCIESPFAGDVERNKLYLKYCVLDCFARDEAPYASHGFYTQFLNDLNPEERKRGIRMGLDWGNCATLRVFYMDYGMSSGMKEAYDEALNINQPYEYRCVEGTLKQAYLEELQRSQS